MRHLKTFDWDGIKADIQVGLKRGVVAFKKGTMVVKRKSGELSEEGKKQYKIMMLKSKVHGLVSGLGATVYSLMRMKSNNPALDAKVKDIVAQIKKIEAQISALENKSKALSKKSFGKAA
jgi:predicted sugar kinase